VSIDWFRFFTWSSILLFTALFWVLVVMSGCSWSQQTRERETVTERNVVQGDVGGVPVALTHDRTVERKRDEDQQGTKDTGLEQIATAAAPILAGGSSLLTGGGAGLAVGLLGMGFAWWKKRQSDSAFQQTVAGLEDAKAQMSPAEVDILHNSLSKNMDASAKARVRSAKAKV
jgi:hypothetical protein